MPARAYILIEAQIGHAQAALTALRAIDQIIAADLITGNYDLIALAQAPDMPAIANLVTAQIQNIPGIRRTITCVAV